MKHLFTKRIAFLLIISTILVLIVFLIFSDDVSLSMNLLTELIGIMVTVFLVDYFIKQNEKRRLLPARLAAAREVHKLCADAARLWEYMIQSSIDLEADAELARVADIALFDRRFIPIICRINLDSRAPVSPERTWDRWLFESVQRMKRQIGNCLSRYSNVLDPKVIQHMQAVETSGFVHLVELLPTIRSENVRMGRDSVGIFFRNAAQTLEEFILPLENLCCEMNKLRSEIEGHFPDVDALPKLNDDFLRAILGRGGGNQAQ